MISLGNTGWICPVCGAANSPWLSQCPCKGKKKGVSYAASTTPVKDPKFVEWEDDDDD